MINPDPHPVKLFVGMLSQEVPLLEELKKNLEVVYGPSDLQSPLWLWEHTDYYQDEMGAKLKRQFIFFENQIHPEEIVNIKLKTVQLEQQHLNERGGRRINLDPGYLDAARIVLVSTKDYSHRIYLGHGVYGEVTLIFSGRDYQVLPSTFPDFRTAEYLRVFKKAREIYKIDRKREGKNQ